MDGWFLLTWMDGWGKLETTTVPGQLAHLGPEAYYLQMKSQVG